MENNTSSQSAPSTGRSYIAFLIFIAILGAFSSLVNDMYLPTIPSMVKEFHTTPSMTQLGLSMAMIGLGIGSVIWGSLSDHYGRKPILVISLILFVIGTAVSLFSNSIIFFILCRLVQGIGAGGGMVLSYSIPADRYQGRQLATVMALVGAINGIAPAGSPLIGGFMADSVGWRGIFVVLLVIGVVMLLWSLRRPESLDPSKRMTGKGIKEYVNAYFSLFADRRFMTYVLLKAIGIGLLYAYISSATFIYQEHYGFSSMQFGMIFGANALAIAVGSTLVMKFKVLKQGLVTGTVIMSVFAIGEAVVMYLALPFVWYEILVIPMLVGSGMLFSSANSLGMEEGKSDAGTAGAILNVVKYVFAAAVAPLVGIGNMLHSSAVCFVAVAVIALILVIPAIRLKPLAEMIKK
ncbi:MAG: multidrug effflux MFS transporter [Muribaculaceae bacterium]|nr:multidrug effflux MFS transporter [Muribaculaceae bacterium]